MALCRSRFGQRVDLLHGFLAERTGSGFKSWLPAQGILAGLAHVSARSQFPLWLGGSFGGRSASNRSPTPGHSPKARPRLFYGNVRWRPKSGGARSRRRSRSRFQQVPGSRTARLAWPEQCCLVCRGLLRDDQRRRPGKDRTRDCGWRTVSWWAEYTGLARRPTERPTEDLVDRRL